MLQCSDIYAGGVFARDVFDLVPGDAEILEFPVGKLRKLADGRPDNAYTTGL